jgi:hypothetical protein
MIMQNEDEQLYKWLLKGEISPVQRVRWPVKVGKWTESVTPILCRSGWHGIREKDVLKHLPTESGATLWVVETKGLVVHGNDKFAAESMRLIAPLEATDRKLRLFAVDCAQDALGAFESFIPGDTRVRECLEVVRRYANGEATEQERSAAKSAAWSAAWSAAESAAWSAAESAAESAAWSAAKSAAWSAAKSAAKERFSNWLVVRLQSDY